MRSNRQAAAPKISILLALGSVLVFGCSHHRETELREFGLTGRISAEPPAFLTGPVSALLTNAAGYSAHVQVVSGDLGTTSAGSSGELLCANGTLLFAPEEAQHKTKGARPGGFTFLWNPSAGAGYVLSESLQAYAPIQGKTHATNVLGQPVSAPQQNISGYACQPQEVTVHMSDGATARFQVLRAPELHDLPVRISVLTNAAPVTLTFSKIRLVSPPAELFAPPDGFSKYPTPEVMADEIAARQRNLMRPARGEEVPYSVPTRH